MMPSGGRSSGRRRSRGSAAVDMSLILTGIILVVAAIALLAYNMWDADRAAKASAEVMEELEKLTDGIEPTQAPVYSGYSKVDDGSPDKVIPDMPTVEINGFLYIGDLEIPSLGLKLPVMDRWDYYRLRISPCLYSGSYFTDDMVICAHNYAQHFSPVKWLDIGSDVYFTTVDKVVYHYQVSYRETIQPTNVNQMIENRNNALPLGVTADWDMTMFTCNIGGQTRCAVRCVRIKDTTEMDPDDPDSTEE